LVGSSSSQGIEVVRKGKPDRKKENAEVRETLKRGSRRKHEIQCALLQATAGLSGESFWENVGLLLDKQFMEEGGGERI